ncbi:CxxH/CxxC protein [Marinococcus luteus]|uniref:CxxH/CxxC protein n=1 Tax=Marinococcus luteus TaxID=1122204 RepID=UPI001FE0572B|nr:CxxH/CxxC protein [Marinococcus luteus]
MWINIEIIEVKKIYATIDAEKIVYRKKDKPLIYCCKEHIEEALDDAVENGEGKAPDVDKFVDENQKISTPCECCSKEAECTVSI